MIKSLTAVAKDNQFLIKSLNNNVIKLACSTPDIYRAIKHCKEQNIYYHPYQLKQDRAFRVVIKHLYYTTDLEDIIYELRILGHNVRNIINVKHRQTKKLHTINLIHFAQNHEMYPVTYCCNLGTNEALSAHIFVKMVLFVPNSLLLTRILLLPETMKCVIGASGTECLK
jgi:hypothetical protein